MDYTVEGHPQLKKIVRMFAESASLRKIAASVTPKVSIMALQRYKNRVLVPAMRDAEVLQRAKSLAKSMDNESDSGVTPEVSARQLASATVAALHADPYVARMAQHRKTIDAGLEFAVADKDAKGIAALVATDIKGLELDARFTGRLDSRPSESNVTVNLLLQIPRSSSIARQSPVLDIPPQPRSIEAHKDGTNSTE